MSDLENLAELVKSESTNANLYVQNKAPEVEQLPHIIIDAVRCNYISMNDAAIHFPQSCQRITLNEPDVPHETMLVVSDNVLNDGRDIHIVRNATNINVLDHVMDKIIIMSSGIQIDYIFGHSKIRFYVQNSVNVIVQLVEIAGTEFPIFAIKIRTGDGDTEMLLKSVSIDMTKLSRALEEAMVDDLIIGYSPLKSIVEKSLGEGIAFMRNKFNSVMDFNHRKMIDVTIANVMSKIAS